LNLVSTASPVAQHTPGQTPENPGFD